MTYGSVELGGALGVQPCEHVQGYHLDDFNYLAELADVDAEGYGEIVVSTLRRRVMPLIRYRTRDVAKFTARQCPCGIGLTSISWLRGRRDEMVVAAGGLLYPQMFANILAKLPITHDWQVILKREGFREVLEINVEAEQLDLAEAQERFRLEASDQYPDFAKNLGMGTFDVRLRVQKPATLRTGRKLPRIVDNRPLGG
jgi:phenylacetate-CoA ligase